MPVLEHIDEYAAVVAITSQERAHICNYFGEHENLFCITHPQEVGDVSAVERSPHRIVLCTRLDPIKRIDHAILAAVRAHGEIPDLELLVYGGGPAEESLRELVAQQGATGYIKLAGYTDRPLEAVASGALTLSTSLFEGWSLSVYEALAMGTPVIAYDYLYGPRFHIEDGKNGRIVENGNLEALARTIVDLLDDPEGLARMSAAARDMDPKYSPETIRAQWEGLFARIDAKPEALRQEEQFAIVRDVRVLGEEVAEGPDGSAAWRLRVRVTAFDGPAPTRFFLFFDACQRIDLRDELYVEGTPTVAAGEHDAYEVAFELTAPRADIDAFRGDGASLRVETEFGCHAEMTRLVLE